MALVLDARTRLQQVTPLLHVAETSRLPCRKVHEVRHQYRRQVAATRDGAWQWWSPLPDFHAESLVSLAFALRLHHSKVTNLFGGAYVRSAICLFIEADDVHHANLSDLLGNE